MRSPPPDLLILGAGPAGTTLATLAAEAGARVTVIDRDTFPRDKVCGEFLAAEGRGVLERLGVLDDLLAQGATRMDAVRVSSLAGRELRAPLPALPGVGRPALGISRRRLDATLLERARRAGATVLERTEAVSPMIEEGRVRGMQVRSVGSGLSPRPVSACLTVAADGRRSVLVRALHPELGDPARSVAGAWFGLKTHLDADAARLEGRVELHLFDGGYAGLGSVEDGRVNLCLMVTVRALREAGGRPDGLLGDRILENPAMRGLLRGARRLTSWKSVGPLRFGARRAAAAGALFVGDAAGTIDPFCGEGMAHALRGAELALPFALEAAKRGCLTADLATDYGRVWAAAFGPITRRVRRIGWLLERHRAGGAAVGLLSRVGTSLFPALVAASRTGSAALPPPD